MVSQETSFRETWSSVDIRNRADNRNFRLLQRTFTVLTDVFCLFRLIKLWNRSKVSWILKTSPAWKTFGISYASVSSRAWSMRTCQASRSSRVVSGRFTSSAARSPTSCTSRLDLWSFRNWHWNFITGRRRFMSSLKPLRLSCKDKANGAIGLVQ